MGIIKRVNQWLVVILLSVITLSGCGGGGGSGAANEPPPPVLTLELGNPSAEPSVIPPSAGTQVKFLAMINGTALPPTVLLLDEIDAAGQVVPGKEGFAQLRDDGAQADRELGDRMYTGTVVVGSISAVEKNYRVRTQHNGATIVSGAMNFWVSGCPATSRPSDALQAVTDTRSNSVIFANEVMIKTKIGVPPDLDRLNIVANGVEGRVVGCIPALRQYLLEIKGDGTANGVYAAINTLTAHPDIAAAYPNAQAIAPPQAPAAPSLLCNGVVDTQCQWYLDRVRAPQAWQLAGGGDPQRGVAVIDFGVDCSRGDMTCDSTLYNQDPIDHGTGVAGIIGSRNNASGMVGVAWNTRMYPYSFLGRSGSQYKMNELITASLSQADVRVINISAGTAADFDGQIKEAVCTAIGSGRLVVAAAGNPSGADAASCQQANIYPARYNSSGETCSNGANLQAGLLVVGATDINNGLASWQNGTQAQCSNQLYVDLYAPGKDIITLSTQAQNGYTTKSGTSYAAPLVSGAASVLWTANPGLSPQQVHDRLLSQASRLTLSNTNPRIQTGDNRMLDKPLLDVYRAVGGQDAIAIPNTTPNVFAITPNTGAPLQALVPSPPVTITGMDSPTPISITGGYYSINNGPFTNAAGSIRSGDQVQVELRAAATPATSSSAQLTIGGVTSTYSVTTRAPLTTPGSFEFAAQSNVAINTSILSNTQTITGIDPAPISISGGEYSINGGAFTTAAGTISTGQSVQVRVTSAATFSTATQATLTIGGVSSIFIVTTQVADTAPDAFAFTAQTNIVPSTQVTSNAITVSGINTPAVIGVSAGEYSINGGPFTNTAGVITNGQSVVLRLTSLAGSGYTTAATLTIGNVSSVFSVTTVMLDTTPDVFAFTAQTNVPVSTTVTSNTITVSGINTVVPISVTGAEYAINGGVFTNAAGTINLGQTVQLRTTSSANVATAVNVTLTIGTVSTVFSVNTVGAITTPNTFTFNAQTNAALNSAIASNTITVSGINTAAPISIVGGLYSIDGGTFTSIAGSVNNNQTVQVQLTSSATPGTTVSATLTIGGVPAVFSITTVPAFTVSTSVGVGGTLTPTSINVIQGANTNVSVIPNTGYRIASVSGCGGTPVSNVTGPITYTTGAINANCAVTANFAINTYSVSGTAAPTIGGTITTATPTVNYNATANFTVTAATGYSISSVSGCGGTPASNVASPYTYTTGAITANCPVTANFTLSSYTVSGIPLPTNGGTITTTTPTVNYNGTANFTVTAITGYSISGISGCGGTPVSNVTSPYTYTTGSVTTNCVVNANFTLNSSTVSGTVTPANGGTITTATPTVTYNSTANFTVTAATGYSITSVSGCGGTPVSNVTSPFTYTTGPVTTNCAVAANFIANTNLVSTSAGIGGAISPTSATVSYGANTNFTITANTGNNIVSASGCGGTPVSNVPGPITYTTGSITTPCTLSATFTINTYIVSGVVTPTAGGTINPSSTTVNFNGTTGVTVTAATGYHIASVSGCGGTAVSNVASPYTYTTGLVTANCPVNANFTLNSYTVSGTPTPANGGTITTTTPTVNYNATANFTVSAATGYSISSVSGCGGTPASNVASPYTYTTGPVTANCPVTANFTQNSYTVSGTAIPVAGGTVITATPTVTYNGTANFTVTAAAGYSISSVSGCGGTPVSNVASPFTYTTGLITANCPVSANFTLNSYTPTGTATPTAGGTITMTTPAPVNYGATANFAVTATTGYSISSVSGCGGTPVSNVASPYTYTTGAITSNCPVTANFTLNSYTVTGTTTPIIGGTISPANALVNYNGTANFTVTAATGYSISSVSGCGGTPANNVASPYIYTSGLITTSCTVTANFTPNSYTVSGSVTPTGSGTITTTTPTVTYNGTANFAVTAADGYSITGVSGCGGTLVSNVTSPYTYTTGPVTANCGVSANFTLNTYTVSGSVTPTGSGTITTTTPTVNYGGTASFTVTPNAGYTIANVVGSTCSVSFNGVTYVTSAITANCLVTASFAINTYTVSVTVTGLTGNGLVLLNNAATPLTLDSVTGVYSITLLSGSSYTLSIAANPTGQTCLFVNGSNSTSGSVINTPVSEALVCRANPITSKLNDTSITADQCYQAGSDALVPCSSAGAIALNPAQDGMVGRDANVATNNNTDGKLGFSFASVAGGCVQDNNTGLMWEVKTADPLAPGLRDWSHRYTNYDSTATAQKLNGTAPTQAEIDAATNSIGFKNNVNNQTLCGFSDWRLPTADELQSIVDGSVAVPEPKIDATWFPNTQSSVYWSASPYVGVSYYAWYVNFYYGAVLNFNTERDTSNFVRLVRAGRPATIPRYTVSADGQEVTDSQTNLIWRRCSEGMVFSSGTCTGTASTFTHEIALTRAKTEASSTGIAWRLPNIKELASIADKSLSNPAIDATAFPATPTNYFWSASPYVGGSYYAWNVHFYDGRVDFGNAGTRVNGYYVRLVRDGP